MLRRLSALFLVSTLLSACAILEPEPDPRVEPGPLSEAAKAVVSSDNAFGLGLFQQLAAADDGNLFISPPSVSFALGMTANGADGDTYDGIRSALGKESLSPEDVNASYRDLSQLLTSLDPEVRLEIANSIWYRLGYPVLPTFLDVNRDFFGAEVAEADFTDPGTVDRINGWVDDKTNGLIDQVIDEIPSEVVMYLINAIYFKGTWQYEFDPDDTRDAPFHNGDGSSSTVPLMQLKADLPVYQTDHYVAVDLPYGDSLFSMTVVLPSAGTTTDDLINGFDTAQWDELVAGLATEQVLLDLPRFKVGYKESLAPALKALGMDAAFDPSRADFSRLVDGGGPWIDDVIHQSVIEVNEEGTEAAAVTVVIIVETSVGGPVSIRVDRPFLLFIRERHTGSVLFTGRINDLS